MPQRIKNSIFKFFNLKRTTLLVLLFFITLGSMFPSCPSNAESATESLIEKSGSYMLFGPLTPFFARKVQGQGWIESLTGAARDYAEGMVAFFLDIMISISAVFLTFAESLLKWVISPDFISVKFTDNPVVNIGWTTVRDFTNMFFILILVIIALGTSLRIKEYEIKKILPTLILIAVLINFTPVICGFIIDASNITMNTFLEGELTSADFDEFGKTIDAEIALISKDVKAGVKIQRAIMLILFNFVGAFVFLLYCLLFIIRYIALWILVIFSPIAFFCYILPQTKGVWSAWWKQFTQWCIIGIIGAFFIYLTGAVIYGISEAETKLVNSPSREVGETGLANIIIWLVPLIFLVIGFFVSMQSSAIGADKAIALSKKAGKKVGGYAKTKAKESAFVKGQTEQWRQRLEWIPENVGTDRMKAQAQAESSKRREKRVKESQETQKHMSVDWRNKFANTEEEKLARFRLANEEEHLDDVNKADFGVVKAIGTEKDISDALKQRPDWAGEDVIRDPKYKTKEEAIRAKVRGTSPIKLRQNNDAKAFESEDVVFSMSPDQVKEITTRGESKQKANIYKTYADEIQKLTDIDMIYNTPEELRNKVDSNKARIQAEIDRLRKTGDPNDSNKAEAIKEIGTALQRRKF